MAINKDEIKIKVKITEYKKLKAIASVDFGDIAIKGFRIQESQFPNDYGQQLWLTPPAYQAGGRFHPMFFMENKDAWKELEQMIYEEYEAKRDEFFKKRLGLKDEDIPIPTIS